MKLKLSSLGILSICAFSLVSISCEVSVSNQADVDMANVEQLKINIQAHDGDEHILMSWNPTNDFRIRDEYVDNVLTSIGLDRNTLDGNYGYKVIAKNVVYPTNTTGGSFDAHVIATYNGDANEATLIPKPRKVFFVSVPGAMQEQDVLNAAKSIKGNNYPSTGIQVLNSAYTFEEIEITDVLVPQVFSNIILNNYGLIATEENNSVDTFPSLTHTFKTNLKYTLETTNDLGSILTIIISKEGTRTVSTIQYKINFKQN